MTASTNVFMNIIYEKVKLTPKTIFKYIKHRRKLKKFMKDIDLGSPSFGLLWKMADFIKASEEVFFYDNSTKNTEFMLFSSRGYIPGENGFKINHPECFIVVKLFSDTERVVVEIERTHGDRLKSRLAFIGEQWEGEPTLHDEMLLEQIIKIINSSMLNLFKHCYDLR